MNAVEEISIARELFIADAVGLVGKQPSASSHHLLEALERASAETVHLQK